MLDKHWHHASKGRYPFLEPLRVIVRVEQRINDALTINHVAVNVLRRDEFLTSTYEHDFSLFSDRAIRRIIMAKMLVAS
ncbi:MAG TPA: hypothetical protein VN826_14070, partial [Candidatus Eisenbacteria bacterium]|nr:hypothetical protein [Candidatus Eisenbacteria bacterium]